MVVILNRSNYKYHRNGSAAKTRGKKQAEKASVGPHLVTMMVTQKVDCSTCKGNRRENCKYRCNNREDYLKRKSQSQDNSAIKKASVVPAHWVVDSFGVETGEDELSKLEDYESRNPEGIEAFGGKAKEHRDNEDAVGGGVKVCTCF